MSREFELRFPIADIPKYAGLYDYPGEAELIAGPVARARTRGRLTYEEFVAIGKWKSQRPRKRQAANPPAFVEEVTRIALARDASPRLAIEVLTLLSGVEWPTASVILHFCHQDPIQSWTSARCGASRSTCPLATRTTSGPDTLSVLVNLPSEQRSTCGR